MTQCLQILKTGFFNSTIPSSEQHSVHPEQVRSLPPTSPLLAAILIWGPCFISISLHSFRAMPELIWLLGSGGASSAAVNESGPRLPTSFAPSSSKSRPHGGFDHPIPIEADALSAGPAGPILVQELPARTPASPH